MVDLSLVEQELVGLDVMIFQHTYQRCSVSRLVEKEGVLEEHMSLTFTVLNIVDKFFQCDQQSRRIRSATGCHINGP